MERLSRVGHSCVGRAGFRCGARGPKRVTASTCANGEGGDRLNRVGRRETEEEDLELTDEELLNEVDWCDEEWARGDLELAQAHEIVLAPRVRRGKAIWLGAMRWRSCVERALESMGLTFVQWLVLELARELVVERGEAVSQNQIAARGSVHRSTVSVAVGQLMELDLVGREIDWTGRAWRLTLEPAAIELLDRVGKAIDDGTRAWSGDAT